MNQEDIERRVELLAGCILDFSGIPLRDQRCCMEYELARESIALRDAVAVRRKFNETVVVTEGETAAKAHERTKLALGKPARRKLEESDDCLFRRGWSFVLEFTGFPMLSWKQAIQTSVHGLYEPSGNDRNESDHRGSALRFWGYASDQNLNHVKVFQRPGSVLSRQAFIIVELDLGRDVKDMCKDLKGTVSYLRRKLDNASEDRGEVRRYDRKGRRLAGGIPGFNAFARRVNAMRVLAGAKALKLKDSEISCLMHKCGFAGKVAGSKIRGQRYLGVEAAKVARAEFVSLFHAFFGETSNAFTITNPLTSLGLEI